MMFGICGNCWRTRYRVIEYTQFYLNFAHDTDFKAVLMLGLDELKEQAKTGRSASQVWHYHAHPPPESVNTTVKLDDVDDRQIYQSLFYGIQSFLGLYVEAFRSCANAKIRQKFKEFLLTEIELLTSSLNMAK